MRMENASRAEIGPLTKTVEPFIARSLVHVLYNFPYLVPYMKELSGFDHDTFKHSICVAETAAKAFTKYAIDAGIPEESLAWGLTTLTLGGYLHDIGKAGVQKYSLEESIQALHPEESRNTQPSFLSVKGQDGRSADERAVIHNHPTIGGYMVRELCKILPISKRISEDVFDFAFSHHEKPADLIGTHNSYSRVSSLRKNPMDALLHTFLSLSDIAVSMREPRSYRGYQSLPFTMIAEELSTELSDGLLESIFGPRQNKAAIRGRIVNDYVLSSVMEHDSVLTQKDYDMEGYRVNGIEWHSTPANDAVLIPSLIKTVWETPQYERRFLTALDVDGSKTWNHKSRNPLH